MEFSAMEITEANTCMVEYTKKVLDSLIAIDEKDEKGNVINTYCVSKDEVATCQAFIYMKKEFPELYEDRLKKLTDKYETVKAKDGIIVFKSLVDFYNENLELIALKNGTVLSSDEKQDVPETKTEGSVDIAIPVVNLDGLTENNVEENSVASPVVVDTSLGTETKSTVEEVSKPVEDIPVVELPDSDKVNVEEQPKIEKTPIKVKVVKRVKTPENKTITLKAVNSVKTNNDVVDKVESAPVVEEPVIEEPVINVSQTTPSNDADNYYNMIKDLINKEPVVQTDDRILTPEEVSVLTPDNNEGSKKEVPEHVEENKTETPQGLPADVEERFKKLDSFLDDFAKTNLNNSSESIDNTNDKQETSSSIGDKIKTKVKVVKRNIYVWKDKATAIEFKSVGALVCKLKNKASEKYLNISHKIAVRKSKINLDSEASNVEDLNRINQMISDKDNNLSYEESVALLNNVANLSNKVKRFAGKSR